MHDAVWPSSVPAVGRCLCFAFPKVLKKQVSLIVADLVQVASVHDLSWAKAKPYSGESAIVDDKGFSLEVLQGHVCDGDLHHSLLGWLAILRGGSAPKQDSSAAAALAEACHATHKWGTKVQDLQARSLSLCRLPSHVLWSACQYIVAQITPDLQVLL